MDQPSPIKVAWSTFQVLRRVGHPSPSGIGSVDHSQFAGVLQVLRDQGLPGIAEDDRDIASYMTKLGTIDPDNLLAEESLAYWLNLYNAGALRLAIKAYQADELSVLRVPGAFDRPVVEVAGEELSLHAIEHAKIRRFRDPRIHGALVCGSVSCPTLRPSPYTGDGLNEQLDDQMERFLLLGGATESEDAVALSRVFLWYGADFVRPGRMPTFLPRSRRSVLASLEPWLPPDLHVDSKVVFQSYDWGLRCTVG